MNKLIKKTIKGQSYEIGHLPALANTALFIKFTSYVGSSLSDFFTMFGNNSDMASIGEGINKLMKSIYVNDPNGEIILEIMSQTMRNGVPINRDTFNQFYTGNISEMTEALMESLMIHFKPFLPLDKISGTLTEKDQKITKSVEI